MSKNRSWTRYSTALPTRSLDLLLTRPRKCGDTGRRTSNISRMNEPDIEILLLDPDEEAADLVALEQEFALWEARFTQLQAEIISNLQPWNR